MTSEEPNVMKTDSHASSNGTSAALDLLFYTNAPKILDTNLDLAVKVNIKSDQSDPVFDVTFVDDTRAVFKTKNLMIEDILSRFHQMCTEKAPKEEPTVLTGISKPGKKRR